MFLRLEIANSADLNEVALESFINKVFFFFIKISNLCDKPLNDFMASIKDFSFIFSNLAKVKIKIIFSLFTLEVK